MIIFKNSPSASSFWHEAPATPVTGATGAATNLQFTEPLPAANKFYRLHKP